jgi:hypothetical protein
MAPPQLAQPSPSAYPRPQQQDPDSPARGRDDSPINGTGKLNELENNPRLPFAVSMSSFELDRRTRDFAQLISAHISLNLLLHAIVLTLTIILTLTYCCF